MNNIENNIGTEELEELNVQLYEKVKAEYEKFINWLLCTNTAEVLDHVYECHVKNDIFYMLEENEFPEDVCKRLLASPCPLEDIYEQFSEHQESDFTSEIRYAIENTNKGARKYE